MCDALQPRWRDETKCMAPAVNRVMRLMLEDVGSFDPALHGLGTGANTDAQDDGQLSYSFPNSPLYDPIRMAIVRQELKVRCQAGQKAKGW